MSTAKTTKEILIELMEEISKEAESQPIKMKSKLVATEKMKIIGVATEDLAQLLNLGYDYNVKQLSGNVTSGLDLIKSALIPPLAFHVVQERYGFIENFAILADGTIGVLSANEVIQQTAERVN